MRELDPWSSDEELLSQRSQDQNQVSASPEPKLSCSAVSTGRRIIARVRGEDEEGGKRKGKGKLSIPRCKEDCHLPYLLD